MAGAPRSPRLSGGSLTLLHFDDAPRVAYLEGLQSGQLVETPDRVTDMALIYDTLRAEALTPDESLAWPQRASENLPA
ncbi:Scr1 family TA system antitoxin-like transcriptional regulator [Streptomyces kaniharaensis]|uniref:Scr1 family TA system antitoxin-like transcriptional regulator n=1 Tax=Streptomyces kaniharaensis TaxID=212423 RepID=UPI00389AEBC2